MRGTPIIRNRPNGPHIIRRLVRRIRQIAGPHKGLQTCVLVAICWRLLQPRQQVASLAVKCWSTPMPFSGPVHDLSPATVDACRVAMANALTALAMPLARIRRKEQERETAESIAQVLKSLGACLRDAGLVDRVCNPVNWSTPATLCDAEGIADVLTLSERFLLDRHLAGAPASTPEAIEKECCQDVAAADAGQAQAEKDARSLLRFAGTQLEVQAEDWLRWKTTRVPTARRYTDLLSAVHSFALTWLPSSAPGATADTGHSPPAGPFGCLLALIDQLWGMIGAERNETTTERWRALRDSRRAQESNLLSTLDAILPAARTEGGRIGVDPNQLDAGLKSVGYAVLRLAQYSTADPCGKGRSVAEETFRELSSLYQVARAFVRARADYERGFNPVPMAALSFGTVPPTPPAENPSPPLLDGEGSPFPPHDQLDLNILNALKKNHPRLLTQKQIEGHGDVSRHTISSRMPSLLAEGLVCQPKGPRKGTTLTPRGEQFLKQFPAKVAR